MTEPEFSSTVIEGLMDYIQVAVPGLDYSKAFIRVNASDEEFASFANGLRALRDALDAAFHETPPDAPQRPQETPQRPAQAQRAAPAPQGASRPAQKGTGPLAALIASTVCDSCGGPVVFKAGFQSKAGKSISAELICARACKDKGKYPHHVQWLDDTESMA